MPFTLLGSSVSSSTLIDSFDRDDDLAGSSTETGNRPWLTTTSWYTNSGQLFTETSGHAVVNCANNNGVITADFDENANLGVVFRWVSSTSYWRAVFRTDGLNRIEIINPSGVIVSTGNMPIGEQLGAMRVELLEASIRVFRAGSASAIVSANSIINQSSPYHGLYSEGAGLAFNSFSYTPPS